MKKNNFFITLQIKIKHRWFCNRGISPLVPHPALEVRHNESPPRFERSQNSFDTSNTKENIFTEVLTLNPALAKDKQEFVKILPNESPSYFEREFVPVINQINSQETNVSSYQNLDNVKSPTKTECDKKNISVGTSKQSQNSSDIEENIFTEILSLNPAVTQNNQGFVKILPRESLNGFVIEFLPEDNPIDFQTTDEIIDSHNEEISLTNLSEVNNDELFIYLLIPVSSYPTLIFLLTRNLN